MGGFVLEYMIDKLGIETSKVPELCFSLYKYYGTTMAGLRVWLKNTYCRLFFENAQIRVPLLKSLFCGFSSLQAIGYKFDYDDFHGY